MPEIIDQPLGEQGLNRSMVVRSWILAFVAFAYPLLYLRMPDQVLGWGLARLVLLLLAGIVGLLYTPRSSLRGLVTGMLLAYLGLVAISTAFAQEDQWVNTLLGEVRLDGTLYQVGLILFGIVAYSAGRQIPGLRRWVAWALLAGAVLETLVVVIQRTRAAALGFGTLFAPSDTPVGTIGHPSVVSGYLAFALVLAIGLSRHEHNWPARAVATIAAGMLAFGVGASGGSAAFYGLLAALSVLVATGVRRQGFMTLLAPLLLVVAGLAVGKTWVPTQGTAAVPGKSYTNMTTLQTRFGIWHLSLDALKYIPGSPWIGGGSSALRLALARHEPPERLVAYYAKEYGWTNTEVLSVEKVHEPGDPVRSAVLRVQLRNEPIPRFLGINLDRGHNFLLDRLLSYGIFSAAIWFILFAVPITRHWSDRRPLVQSYAVACLAVFAYYLAWFPSMEVEPVFVLGLMLVWCVGRTKPAAMAMAGQGSA